MVEYVILGTSHLVQESGELEEAVEAAAANHGIVLIAEENPYDIDSTAARQVARSRDIPYLQVDPSPSEWALLEIDREMDLRNQCFQREDVRLSHADNVRENLWLKRIEASAKHGRVIVICGYLRVDFFAEKVRKQGGRVVDKSTFPPNLLGTKPEKVLNPTELEELARTGQGAGP